MKALEPTTLSQIPSGFWAGLFLLWLASSVVYRLYFTKPLLATTLPNATFSERWASTRIGTGLVARLGTARNCIHVQVTATELKIHPHFPFTLGFMPEIYDLDHTIPLEKLRSATILSDGRAKAVEVKYTTHGGNDGTAHLLLRDAETFVHAVLAHKRNA